MANTDTRFARRASRESDGLSRLLPGVALSESGNPGLISSTPSVSSACRAMRETKILSLRLMNITWLYDWLCTPSRTAGFANGQCRMRAKFVIRDWAWLGRQLNF
jgi:hypothetical protein